MVPVRESHSAGRPWYRRWRNSRRCSWPGRPAERRRSPERGGSRTRPPAALSCPHDPVGFRRDQALVVQTQKHKGLHELGLNGGSPDGQNGFAGENRRSLGNGPDVAGEGEVPQVVQKRLREAVFGPQIGDILLIKVEILNIFHHLRQTGGDGKAALVRDRAVKHVKNQI